MLPSSPAEWFLLSLQLFMPLLMLPNVLRPFVVMAIAACLTLPESPPRARRPLDARDQCGFSNAVVRVLEMHGVDPGTYAYVNVLEDEAVRTAIKKFSCVDLPTAAWPARGVERSVLIHCSGCVTSRVAVRSNWPTIPQLYVKRNFIGGCDIVVNMHNSGELAELLRKAGITVAGASAAPAAPSRS